MFSPITKKSLLRLSGFMFDSHGLELAALDEEVKEIRHGFELDMLDALDQFFHPPALAVREQHLARAGERRVPHLDDAFLGHRREKSNIDGVAHVDVVG